MRDSLKHLAYEIELQPGERLTLPPGLIECVGPGRWIVTVEPAGDSVAAVRRHTAFLNGYSSTDEGLYDDSAR
jgi:hypothetical protein